MQYLVYILCRAVLGLFGLLPIRLVYGIGWLLGRLAYFIAGPYRKLALNNLKVAFPEESEATRRSIAREHFARLVANLLSGIRINSVSNDELTEIAHIYNGEVFDRL